MIQPELSVAEFKARARVTGQRVMRRRRRRTGQSGLIEDKDRTVERRVGPCRFLTSTMRRFTRTSLWKVSGGVGAWRLVCVHERWRETCESV